MKKPGFFESKIAAIEINANYMIWLGGSRAKIRVVTVRHEQVHQAVLVEIGEFKAGVSPTGLLLEDQMFREMSLAIAGENEHGLQRLRHQDSHVLVAVLIEVVHGAIQCSGLVQEHVLLILVAAFVLEPGKPADKISIDAQGEVFAPVFVEIAKFEV